MNRLRKFYGRWKNQYRIHRSWASLWQITKQAWVQSRMRGEKEMNVKVGGSPPKPWSACKGEGCEHSSHKHDGV